MSFEIQCETEIFCSDIEFKIQALILNLDSDNFDNTLQKIKFIYETEKNESFLIDLFAVIVNSVKIRFNQVENICRLACSFYKSYQISRDNLNKLLECLIFIFPDNDTYLRESYRLFFLTLLLKENFFNIDDVVNIISKLFHNYSNISRYLSLIFIWLSPEIFENNPEFFEEFHQFFVSTWEFEYTSLVIYDVFIQFEKYRENDWKILREHRSIEFHKLPISYFISKDMVDELQNALIQSKKDVNFRCPLSSYEWRPFLQKCPTILLISAFYGSIKCFKYLLLNGASLDSNDFEGKTIAHFAVAGGNNEIIRVLHQKNVSFSGTLQVAASFHRNDVFQWILENNISELDEIHEVMGNVFHQAIISSNYPIINLCLSRNFDINCCNSDGIFFFFFFIGHLFILHHFIVFQKWLKFF